MLEVNPRLAHRAVCFKATGVPLAKCGALHGRTKSGAAGYRHEVIPPYYSVKEAVFLFIKFPAWTPYWTEINPPASDGVGETFAEAFVKSQLAASVKLPVDGKVFISVREGTNRAWWKPPVHWRS